MGLPVLLYGAIGPVVSAQEISTCRRLQLSRLV